MMLGSGGLFRLIKVETAPRRKFNDTTCNQGDHDRVVSSSSVAA